MDWKSSVRPFSAEVLIVWQAVNDVSDGAFVVTSSNGT